MEYKGNIKCKLHKKEGQSILSSDLGVVKNFDHIKMEKPTEKKYSQVITKYKYIFDKIYQQNFSKWTNCDQEIFYRVWVESLLRMLYLKAAFEESEYSPIYSVGGNLDQLWHSLILETRVYSEICHTLYGKLVNHTQTTVGTMERENLTWHDLQSEYANFPNYHQVIDDAFYFPN